MNVIAYRRVSTVDQGDSGLGLDAQTAAIETYCAQCGYTITQAFEDVDSGAKQDRQGFQQALDSLQKHEADGLVVAKLDRLTRSLAHFAEIMELSRKQGWALIALDLGVDTSTPAGELMAAVLATFAQYERRLIGERTKAGLAALKARDPQALDKPHRRLADDLRNRIKRMRTQGMTLRAICEQLTLEEVATAQGGAWRPGTVAWVLAH